MLYIFDQQRGPLATLGVMLDCVVSLLRQWTLRPHIDAELPAAPLRSPMTEHIPSFATLDTFQPRASAIIYGTLLSLILFYMTVFAIRYSWIHVLNLHIPEIEANATQPLSRHSNNLAEHLPVDVIPTDADDPQSKAIASSSPRTPAAHVPPRRVVIWLDQYVGRYISNHPPAKIWIQIERDPLTGDHLSLSLAAAGKPSVALSPVSPAKFAIVGAENGYVAFTADAQGGICCLSWVVNGNVITAQRQ